MEKKRLFPVGKEHGGTKTKTNATSGQIETTSHSTILTWWNSARLIPVCYGTCYCFQKSRNVGNVSGRPDELLAKERVENGCLVRNFIGWFGIYGPAIGVSDL